MLDGDLHSRVSPESDHTGLVWLKHTFVGSQLKLWFLHRLIFVQRESLLDPEVSHVPAVSLHLLSLEFGC